jgi:hypothetical protein
LTKLAPADRGGYKMNESFRDLLAPGAAALAENTTERAPARLTGQVV